VAGQEQSDHISYLFYFKRLKANIINAQSQRSAQALNIDLFTQLGCDPASKKIVVVKSAQHFHASFSTIAHEIIYVGAPGSAIVGRGPGAAVRALKSATHVRAQHGCARATHGAGAAGTMFAAQMRSSQASTVA